MRLGFDYRGPIDEETPQIVFVSPDGRAVWGLLDFTHIPARFLQHLFIGLIYQVFGTNFDGYFLVYPVLYAVIAFVFWRILLKFVPDQPWLALAASLLFLVYPADATRTDLTMLMLTQSLLFYAFAVWLMLHLDERPGASPLLWGLMVLLIIASLLSYEQLTPVVLVTPLLLLLHPADVPRRHRLILGGVWLAVFAAYGLWRLYFVLAANYLHHFGGGNPEYTLTHLLASYLQWIRMGLLHPWYEAFVRTRWSLALRSPDLRLIPLWFPVLIVLVIGVGGWLLIARQLGRDGDEPGDARPIRVGLVAIAVGLAMMGVAYLTPPLAFDPPVGKNLGFVPRFHAMPSPFMALAVAALALIASQLARRYLRLPGRLHLLLGWGAISVVATFSMLWHISINMMWLREDWLEKAEIWRGVLEAAPGVEPDTLFLFLRPPRPEHLRGQLYESSYLKLFYDDPTLAGEAIGHSRFITSISVISEEGVELAGRHYPWDQVVLIELSPDEKELDIKLVECLPDDLIPESVVGPLCGNPARVDHEAELGEVARQWLYRPHVTGVERNPFRAWLPAR